MRGTLQSDVWNSGQAAGNQSGDPTRAPCIAPRAQECGITTADAIVLTSRLPDFVWLPDPAVCQLRPGSHRDVLCVASFCSWDESGDRLDVFQAQRPGSMGVASSTATRQGKRPNPPHTDVEFCLNPPTTKRTKATCTLSYHCVVDLYRDA